MISRVAISVTVLLVTAIVGCKNRAHNDATIQEAISNEWSFAGLFQKWDDASVVTAPNRVTYAFHYTKSDLPLRSLAKYFEQSVAGIKKQNEVWSGVTQLDDGGAGLYVAADPFLSKGFGDTLVVVALKPNVQAPSTKFEDANRIAHVRGNTPLLAYKWGMQYAMVIRDLSVVDLDKSFAISCTNCSQLPLSTVANWQGPAESTQQNLQQSLETLRPLLTFGRELNHDNAFRNGDEVIFDFIMSYDKALPSSRFFQTDKLKNYQKECRQLLSVALPEEHLISTCLTIVETKIRTLGARRNEDIQLLVPLLKSLTLIPTSSDPKDAIELKSLIQKTLNATYEQELSNIRSARKQILSFMQQLHLSGSSITSWSVDLE